MFKINCELPLHAILANFQKIDDDQIKFYFEV